MVVLHLLAVTTTHLAPNVNDDVGIALINHSDAFPVVVSLSPLLDNTAPALADLDTAVGVLGSAKPPTPSSNHTCLVSIQNPSTIIHIFLLSSTSYPLSDTNISPQTRFQIGKQLRGSSKSLLNFSIDLLVMPCSRLAKRITSSLSPCSKT